MPLPSPDAPDYLTDVPYLRTFSADLSPTLLRAVAALNGFSPPPAEDFDYAELGCGNGDTTATLAAANPEGRFLGVDMNPEHIAFANGLVKQGGLSNVGFLQRDFEGLVEEGLPGFDFLCAHGVMSWISPEKRRALIALASSLLKPGGLLFVSYNAQPGWAAIEPLRRLMLDASPPGESSLERAKRGFLLAKRLAEAGAEYFTQNPAARSMLATMTEMGSSYVVHEYLQPHWHPLYFADVATEMAREELHFIGQLPLHLNYRDLSLSASLLPLFEGVRDRLAFEALKDVARNEFFRRDVYVKGRAPRSDEVTRAYLETTPFGTLGAEATLSREVHLGGPVLRFEGALFETLIPLLASGATTVEALSKRPDLAVFGDATLRSAMQQLLLGGLVAPMRRSTEAVAVGEDRRFAVELDYNRMILKQKLSDRTPTILASTAAGTGLTLSLVEALCLRLLTEVEPGARAAWIRSFVTKQPLRLQVRGQEVEGVEARAKALEDELAEVMRARLPKLLELGVLA
jgi:SAM-dependent methyltransferase